MRPMAAEGSTGRQRPRPKLVAVPVEPAPPGSARDATAAGAGTSGARTGDASDQSSGSTGPAPVNSHRRSDVDEWGRSQHLRDRLARLYDPVYDKWLRVEWEGFEKIPREGGALMVANHAGAIPADAPSIMHGIERQLGRPVYGLADEMFKKVPVVTTRARHEYASPSSIASPATA